MIPQMWRDYKFILTGETMRAFEIGVLGAAVEVVGQFSSLTDFKTYAIAVTLAVTNFTVSFIKGRVPPKE